MSTGALEGLRIIDTSSGYAGGYCTRLLAGLGADVIKVEKPPTGDTLRRAGPFPGDIPHRETSGMHLHLNAAKRSTTLDTRTTTGRDLLRRLCATADILVCDSSDAAGLAGSQAPPPADGWERLITTTITPYGPDSPRAGDPASELTLMAASGYLSLNGAPEREPVHVWGEQAHYHAGLHAALGTLAALRARAGLRARDAGGQSVDVSIVEAAGMFLAGALQRETLMRRPQRRAGPRPAGFDANRLYPSTVRPCADGHVHVHCHNRFPDLISVLMEEPRLATPDILAEPLGHADEIDALMDRWLATRTRAEAVHAAQELRVPLAEVLTPAEVVDDVHGQHAARGFFTAVEHPAAGAVTLPGAPIVMERTPWRIARAPLLGEHNAEVFAEIGVTPRDLAALAAAGVV